MTREEKENIFYKFIGVPYAIFRRKFKKSEAVLLNKDDIIQEGLIALWRGIDEGKVFEDNGEVSLLKLSNICWSYMGTYIRRKVLLDDRVKMNKDVSFCSLNVKVKHIEDNNLIEYIDMLEDTSRSFEDLIEGEAQYEYLMDFYDKVDKFCFEGKRRYLDVLKSRLKGNVIEEVAKEINMPYSTTRTRLREMRQLYLDTIA